MMTAPSTTSTAATTTPSPAPTPACGNGVIDAGEECDAGMGNNSDTDPSKFCSSQCKKKGIACCPAGETGPCLRVQPNAFGVLPATCITTCSVPSRCTSPQFGLTTDACGLTCPICTKSTTCGVSPGCQAGIYKGMACDSCDDCAGAECVLLDDACQADTQCEDCALPVAAAPTLPRAQRCQPCLVCTPEQIAATAGLVSPNALLCCPPTLPTTTMAPPVTIQITDGSSSSTSNNARKRAAVWSDESGCLSNDTPQTCRPQLSCKCGFCTDSCDFNISSSVLPFSEQRLPADQAGVSADDMSTFAAEQQLAQVPTDAEATKISETMCRALRDRACHLHPHSDIKTSVQPHNATTLDLQPYVREFFDIFNIHAPERLITVNFTYALAEITGGSTTRVVRNTFYLISALSNCCDPVVYAPFSVLLAINGTQRYETSIFLVPAIGDYILVHSAVFAALVVTQPVLNALDQIRCIDGEIGIEYEAPTCPDVLCNQRACIDTRDCNISSSCSTTACDLDYHRCILARSLLDRQSDLLRNTETTGDEPFADENALPSGDSIDGANPHSGAHVNQQPKKSAVKDVCEGAKNGERCINRIVGTSDPLKCALGTCINSVCTTTQPIIDSLFECDCKCERQCKNQGDCDRQCAAAHANDAPRNDSKVWTGFCLHGEGACVCRLEPKPTPRTTATNSTSSSTSTRLSTTTAPGATTTTVVGGTAAPTPGPTPATIARTLGRQTIQLVGYKSPLAILSAPDEVAPVKTAVTRGDVLRVMDATELRRTQLSLDISGSSALCNDIEQRPILVRAAHKQMSECARVDVVHKCLESATLATTGHDVVDRAVLATSAAAEYAQANVNLAALERACCALVYYNALSEVCGTTQQSLQALDTYRVVRNVDGVGPACVAFDDGHYDRDINEFTAKQRVVEIRSTADNRLVAINIYVVPLARGGGYTVSYAISLRGASIQSVDNGANAACSERARAVMRETFDPASVAALLRGRKQFPEGTRVSTLSHVEYAVDDARQLPPGIASARCVTLGGTRDDAACERTDVGDIAIVDDLRKALPPVQGDAIDLLLAEGVRVDQSTNTHHNAPTVRTRFSSSSVVLLPDGVSSTAALDASSIRYVLRNEDCGAAILLLTPAEQRASSAANGGIVDPIAFTIPPHSCAAWRWADEGVRLIQDAASDASVCRGGSESGLMECKSDVDATCTSAGGDCAPPPSVAGVPYRNARHHFECKVCYTDALCAIEPACASHACCADEVLHWYRYPNADLVYAGHQLDIAEAILKTAE